MAIERWNNKTIVPGSRHERSVCVQSVLRTKTFCHWNAILRHLQVTWGIQTSTSIVQARYKQSPATPTTISSKRDFVALLQRSSWSINTPFGSSLNRSSFLLLPQLELLYSSTSTLWLTSLALLPHNNRIFWYLDCLSFSTRLLLIIKNTEASKARGFTTTLFLSTLPPPRFPLFLYPRRT